MDVTAVPWTFLDPLFGPRRPEDTIRAKLSMQEMLLQEQAAATPTAAATSALNEFRITPVAVAVNSRCEKEISNVA